MLTGRIISMDVRLRAAAVGILVLLCLGSLLFLARSDAGRLTVEDGTVRTSDGVSIAYRTYVPAGEGPYVLVLIGHGFSASKEIMDGYARALADAGYLVYSYDHRGHGRSGGVLGADRDELVRDIVAVRDAAQADTRVTAGPYGLVGYSMGGGSGYRLAGQDPDLVAMVGVAPALDEAGDVPPRLLVLVGALNELFSPSSYRALLSTRTGRAPDDIESGTTYETGGLSTELVVLPWHDHLTISYSAAAHERCVSWLAAPLGGAPPDVRTVRRTLFALSGLSSGLGAAYLVIPLLPYAPSRRRLRARPTTGLARDAALSVLYAPVTAALVVPTILCGLPLTTGYLLLLSLGAVPLWRALRAAHPGRPARVLARDLFAAPAHAYAWAAVTGFVIYAVIVLFLGVRYLGVTPPLARLPATVCAFCVLVGVCALDAWAYAGGPYRGLFAAARYALARLASIALLVFVLSLISGNAFFLIALYAGMPLVVVHAAVMMAVVERTNSYGAAAVCSALFLAPLLAAVSPRIGVL